MLPLDMRRYHVHFRLGLLDRRAAPQLGNDVAVGVVPVFEILGCEPHRSPDLGVAAGETEVGRHDADDEEGSSVEQYLRPDDGAVAAEARLPQSMAQEKRSRGAVPVVLFGEDPSEE